MHASPRRETRVTKSDAASRIYTVVDVLCGVAVGAYTFRSLKKARLCATRLREGRNLQEDDVQLFECMIDPSPREWR
jgi:hypothetical protein